MTLIDRGVKIALGFPATANDKRVKSEPILTDKSNDVIGRLRSVLAEIKVQPDAKDSAAS